MSDRSEALRSLDLLMKEAHYRTLLAADPDYQKLQRAIHNGEEIPDELLPGRLLNKLTPEEREDLQKLKSEWIENWRMK